jgi:hypothetical protein
LFGDVIETGAQSRVVIALSDGSLITVAANSRIALKDFRQTSGLRELLDVVVGRVRAKIHLDLGAANEQVFLLLFGTGAHNRTALGGVTVTAGCVSSEVIYAGAQNGFAGLDQLNLRLARQLSGRGEVKGRLPVDGKAANPVKLWVK